MGKIKNDGSKPSGTGAGLGKGEGSDLDRAAQAYEKRPVKTTTVIDGITGTTWDQQIKGSK